MRLSWLPLLVLVACTGKEKLPEIYLLQGACEVSVKTDDKNSSIFIDGILIGHGEAKSGVPCGEKKIEVEAPGKKMIDEYQTVAIRVPLELSYKLDKAKHVEDWAMSPELIEQLAKGEGPYDKRDPKSKALMAQNAKERDEQGYNYTTAELAAAAKKLLGSDETAGAAGGEIKIDPSTNFDDPKTWM